jgi:hypothetical protein
LSTLDALTTKPLVIPNFAAPLDAIDGVQPSELTFAVQ